MAQDNNADCVFAGKLASIKFANLIVKRAIQNLQIEFLRNVRVTVLLEMALYGDFLLSVVKQSCANNPV